MSVDPGEQLRFALESELCDLVASDDLAALVIARHGARRQRRAAAAALCVALAGIGVPLGLMSAPTRSGPVELRLASYVLKLPHRYHLSEGKATPCAVVQAASPVDTGSTTDPGESPLSVDQPKIAAAATSAGGCVLMMITASFTPAAPGSKGDPNIPPGAKQVAVGMYQAWLVPVGYWGPPYVPPHSAKPRVEGLVIEVRTPGRQIQDLVIGSSGLSRAALISLVSNNLSS